MQCSPFLDCTWDKQNNPTTCATSYTHGIGFHSLVNILATHHNGWAGSQKTQIAWAVLGLRPLQTPLNRGTPHFKIPPVLVL